MKEITNQICPSSFGYKTENSSVSSFRPLSPLHNIYDLRYKRPILLILHTNTSTSDKTFRSVEIHKIHKSFGEISDPVHTDW